MDQNVQFIIRQRIARTMESLKKHNMQPYSVPDAKAACALALELVADGDIVGLGGSMTAAECGLLEELRRQERFTFLDRARPGITPQEVEQVYRDTFSSDVYFSSSNAITEQGELFNVDGNSNRVAAMLFGPKSVVIIAGYNKIVPDMDAALLRLRQVAGPANAKRLSCPTPCAQTGVCEDCQGSGRICCNYVVMAHQRTPGRVKVILVEEPLGY